MWGFFFWPFMFMVPIMIIMTVLMVGRSMFSHGRAGFGCGLAASGPRPKGQSVSEAHEDPIVTLRERYARGDIDGDEFEQRLDGLLRSEPKGEVLRGSPGANRRQ